MFIIDEFLQYVNPKIRYSDIKFGSVTLPNSSFHKNSSKISAACRTNAGQGRFL